MQPKAKISKKINVKSHIRTKKDLTATIVDQHMRNDEVNVEHPVSDEYMESIGYDPRQTVIKDAMDLNVVQNKIPIPKLIGSSLQGVNDTYSAFIKGNTYYIKPVSGESIVSTGNYFLRKNGNKLQEDPHISLNGSDNKPLSFDEQKRIHEKLRENKKWGLHDSDEVDNTKGQTMHREMATVALAKILGLNHVNKGAIKKTNFKHKKDVKTEELAFFSKDLTKDHCKPGEILNKAMDVINPGRSDFFHVYKNLTHDDPKFGDKIMFEYLIGNTDRHKNNFFVKEIDDQYVSNKKYEMLAFDHGLTFGNSNDAIHKNSNNGFEPDAKINDHYSLTAQQRFLHVSEKTKVTSEFRDKIKDIIQSHKKPKDKNGNAIGASKSNDMRQFVDFIERKIGKKEAELFKERFNRVAKHVLENKDNANLQNMFEEMNPQREKKNWVQ